MNLVQITPGAGGMYCGNCFRDNALVAELRRQGHQTLMVPLYLPMRLEEADQSAGTPIFFSGISVYLEQQSALFQRRPHWLHQLLASPRLLRWAAGRAARTRGADTGDILLSMLRGEEGRQARELEELVAWLKTQTSPDAICLSNALLIGLTRQLRRELRVPVISMLQGEDSFLDSLPMPLRDQAWQLLAERAREIDLFLAPSRYFADLMTRRLQLDPGKVKVVANGINLDGFTLAATDTPPPSPPVLGFFARMCADKGLHLLVDTYLELRRRNRVPNLQLKIGGGCGPSDEPFVAEQKARLRDAGFLKDATFHPNLSREEKIRFLQSLTVFSVPALYGEAFGLYLLEALAAGVPVVQPEVAAFPEIITATGGGLAVEPNSVSLADALEKLLCDPALARKLGRAGQSTVFQKFGMAVMAADFANLLTACPRPAVVVPT